MGRWTDRSVSLLMARLRPYILPFIFLAICLGGLEFMFSMERSHQIRNTLQGIKGLFNDENVAPDAYIYARRLNELENLGVISCSILSEGSSKISYYDSTYKSNCRRKRLISETVRSLNGSSVWGLHVDIPETPSISLVKYLARFLIVIFFVLLGYRLDAASKARVIAYQESRWMREFAQQLKHDSASPLGALQIATKFPDLNPKLREFLESAVERTSHIFEDLDLMPDSATPKLFDVSELIRKVVAESSDSRIRLTGDSCNGWGDSRVMARIVSNLINNALEMTDVTQINLLVQRGSEGILVSIIDDGPGFPDIVLSGIRRGLTVNKPGGSGLGLFHAQSSILRWGGELSIRNLQDGGAEVLIRLLERRRV